MKSEEYEQAYTNSVKIFSNLFRLQEQCIDVLESTDNKYSKDTMNLCSILYNLKYKAPCINLPQLWATRPDFSWDPAYAISPECYDALFMASRK